MEVNFQLHVDNNQGAVYAPLTDKDGCPVSHTVSNPSQ